MRLNNDKEAVKLKLVYTVTSLLLNNNLTVVLVEFFVNLVDNLENFNNFPWGKVLWENSTAGIKNKHKMSEQNLNVVLPTLITTLIYIYIHIYEIEEFE